MPRYFTIPRHELDQLRSIEDARDDARELLDMALARAEGLVAAEVVKGYQAAYHSADREADDRLNDLVNRYREETHEPVVSASIDYQTCCLTLGLASDDDDDDEG